MTDSAESTGETDGATGADGTAGTEDSADDDAYSGILGAFPYAYRTSESRLFRAYAAVGGLVALAVVLLFALALVVLLGGSAAATGGTFTFSRAFFIALMFLVIAPLVAPVLSVARRHRRSGSTLAYDRAVAATGFAFLASLFVMLAASVPAVQQSAPGGPVVALLYVAPRVSGVAAPLAVSAALVVVHRRFR
jgi:hypothetical protein